MLPSTPAMVMPASVIWSSVTAKPANSMMASLGTGIQALSSSIRRKTAGRPQSPMSCVHHCTTALMIPCMPASVPHGRQPGHIGAVAPVGGGTALW